MFAMRRAVKVTTFALGAAVALAGCKQIEELKDAREFADRASRVAEQKWRVQGDPSQGIGPLPGTAFEEVPTTGSATFTGSAFIAMTNVDRRRDTHLLVGDARVDVDFSNPNDAVSGSVTNMRRTEALAVSTNIAGQLDLTTGQIGNGAPNDLSIAYDGFVTPDGTRIGLDGVATGKLRGTRPDATNGQSVVRAIDVTDADTNFTAGGATYEGHVTIIGEN